MAAYSGAVEYRGSSGGGLRFPVFPVLIVAAILAATAVIVGQHATAKHGDEAESIRKCLSNNGPYQVWRDRTGDLYKLCKLADGRWGAQIIAKDGAEYYEKTAYVKGDGAWNTIMRWLQGKGATRYTGQVP